jgi:prevent-host-death family protein
MRKIPEIVPITDFRHDAAGVLKRAQSSKEPLIITQRGRASAVLLSVDVYEQTEHNLEILRLLALGEKEIAAGKGYDLDVILAEADALLAEGIE